MNKLTIFNIIINPIYTEIELWNDDTEVSKGRFAYMNHQDKKIYYFPRWYYTPIWKIMKVFISAHEYGHSWGIPKTGCISNRSDCIMSEENGEENFINKIKMWPAQLLNFGRFCPNCEKFILDKINK